MERDSRGLQSYFTTYTSLPRISPTSTSPLSLTHKHYFPPYHSRKLRYYCPSTNIVDGNIANKRAQRKNTSFFLSLLFRELFSPSCPYQSVPFRKPVQRPRTHDEDTTLCTTPPKHIAQRTRARQHTARDIIIMRLKTECDVQPRDKRWRGANTERKTEQK